MQPYPSLAFSVEQDSWQSVSVCVIVSICQDKQVPDSVRREKEHQSVGQMCAEVGFDWLTGSVCVIWKQFVWKCEKGCRGLVRLREWLSHPFSHEPFTCTQTHSHLFQKQLLFGHACTCTLKAYFVLKGMSVLCCSSQAAHRRSFSSPFALTESCMVGPVGGVKAEVCRLCKLQNKLEVGLIPHAPHVCLHCPLSALSGAVSWDWELNWFQNRMIFMIFSFVNKICIC